MTASEYLKWAPDRDAAFELYKRDISTFTADMILADLEAKYGMVQGKIIHNLIAINACPSCGQSQSIHWSTCESCWETNDDYFEALGALVESHPIGRARSTGMRGSNIDLED